MADANIIVKIVDQTRGGIGSVTSTVDNLGRSTKNVGSNMDSLQKKILAVGGAIATSFAVKYIVDATTKFQDLQDTLDIVAGSATAGGQAFDFLAKFATTTQFGVNELAETFIKLKTAGIEPTQALLTTFTDTAAVTTDQIGTLQAITDLFARTTSGGLGLEELNRLADRGVPVFRLLEEQLGITRLEVSEFGKTSEGARQITEALITGLNQEFGGATNARLDNLSTAMSNFGIATELAAAEFGKGFAPVLTQVTNDLTDYITKNEETIASIGELVGKGLKFLIDNLDLVAAAGAAFFTMFAVNKMVAITSEFASLARGAATFLAAMAPSIIAGVSGAIATLRTGIVALNATMLTNPIALAVAAISAAVLLAIEYWDDFGDVVKSAIDGASNVLTKLELALLDLAQTAINGVINSVLDMGQYFGSVLSGIAAAVLDPFNAFEAFRGEIKKGQERMESNNVTVVDFSGRIATLKGRIEESTDAVDDNTDAHDDQAGALDNSKDATDDLTDATDDETDAVDDNTIAVEDNENAQDKLESQLKNTETQVKRVEDAFDDYSSKLERNVYLSGLSSEARELEEETMRALEARAQSLGVTVENLSEIERKNVEDYVAGQISKKRANEDLQDAIRDFDRETNRQIEDNYRNTTSKVKQLEDELQDYLKKARELGVENHASTQDAIASYERQINQQRIEDHEEMLEGFKTEYSAVYDDMFDLLGKFTGKSRGELDKFNQYFKLFTGTDLLGSWEGMIGNMIGGVSGTFVPGVQGEMTGLGTWIGNFFSAGQPMLGGIGNFVSAALGLFGESGFFGGIKNIFGGIGDWIGGFFGDLFGGVKNIFGDLFGGINDFFGGIFGGIGDFFGDLFGGGNTGGGGTSGPVNVGPGGGSIAGGGVDPFIDQLIAGMITEEEYYKKLAEYNQDMLNTQYGHLDNTEALNEEQKELNRQLAEADRIFLEEHEKYLGTLEDINDMYSTVNGHLQNILNDADPTNDLPQAQAALAQLTTFDQDARARLNELEDRVMLADAAGYELAQQGAVNVNFNIQAWDGQSVEDTLINNRQVIMDSLRQTLNEAGVTI